MNRVFRTILAVLATAVFGLAAVGQTVPQEAGPPVTQSEPADPSMPEAPAEIAPNAMASPLKPVESGSERSEQLEQIARQVDRQTRHGFDLAGRGAYFAARAEFVGALKLLAEGLDTDEKTDSHGRALAAASTAIREAEDFLPNGAAGEANADLRQTIAIHTTPVLKDETGNITAVTALKCYFTFAQEQYAAAVGKEVAGSMALHALGKLHNALAQKKSGLVRGAESKAMVYYQAALLAYPQNFMAANDLGVLLAQNGNYADARTVLEHSLSLSPQSVTWHNLAVVYGQLGQPGLARQADQQAAAFQQAEAGRRKMVLGTTNSSVVWLDSQMFAKTSSNTPNTPGAAPPANQASPGSGSPTPQGAKTAKSPTSAERMSWRSRTNH